jgi:P27 family predicted phage terminase small subunit
MSGGRQKPKPTAQRRLEGNPGKRAYNHHEPSPPPMADDGAIPVELDDNPIALSEWRRLVPLLRRARQISEADRAALLALCVEWSRYRAANAEITAHGLVLENPNGFLVSNPAVRIIGQALNGCCRLWAELGLTPSSRSKVKEVSPPAEGDAFTEFDGITGVNGTAVGAKH